MMQPIHQTNASWRRYHLLVFKKERRRAAGDGR